MISSKAHLQRPRDAATHEPIYSAKDIAEILGCSNNHVHALAYAGRLPPADGPNVQKKKHKTFTWKKSTIENWRKSQA